jgi:hypothetical protein
VPRQPKKPEEEHINPLLKNTSQGFGNAPKGWGAAEEEEEEEEEKTPVPPAQSPIPILPSSAPTPPEQLPPLLYKSSPSAEYMMRPFDRRYDKQAVNINPYLSGALAAAARVLKQTKTEQYEEMMLDYIRKHADILERYPDLVRGYEEEMRKKHNL